MEIERQKNVATYITFPLVDADGDFVSGCTGLDSNIDQFSDGGAPGGFAVCNQEASEIGGSGVYSLSLIQAEMNDDYIVITIASNEAKTQMILIRTMVGDPLLKATTSSGALVWSVGTKVITGGVLTTPADYKATGFSVPNEYDGVIADLQADLDSPAQYKADVTDMATNTNVDANETKIDTAITNIGNLENLSSANIQTVLETNDLDHLVKIAHPTGDPVQDSLIDLIMNKDGTQTFARADDSLQGISEGAAGGGASAQEVWEYASPRTLTTPADYKATGFSTHAAADIWSVGTRVITGGVLTTPNDYKATGFSVHVAADIWSVGSRVITGGILTTPSDYKATGFSVPNEYDAVITALQTDLDNPAQYKATVTDYATETNATTNTTNIQTNIDANETKIDTMQGNVTDILTDTGTTLMAELLRIRGLSGEFIVAEYTFVGDDNTIIEYWQYDNVGNFNTHDKSTGLIGKWILNITFTDNKPTVAKSKRLS